MKKITLLFTFLIAFGYSTYAQVSAYSFSESTEAYAQITGTTSTATGDDGSQNTIAIGFTFNFDGTNYTTFSINTNGFIRLGNTIAGSPWTNSLANAAAQRPLIAPFWDDNNMTGGEIRYAVTGTAPNQVLTINWHNSKIGSTGSTAGPAVSTLLRLYETTNIIEFIYSNPYTTTNTVTASVGLNGASSFLSVTPAASSTVSSATANNAINATVMANLAGKKLIFTPPTPCAGTPVAGTVSPVNQTLLAGQTPAALVASGYSSGVSGITFQWQESDDDGAGDAWANAVGGTGATTASYTPPAFSGSTIYYRLVVTCTNGGGTANTASVVLNPCGTFSVPTLENFTTFLPGCWQEADNGDLIAGPATFGAGSWAVDGFGNVGTTGAIKINIDATGDNDWILSPLYAIPATGYELKFDAAATQFASTNAPTNAWETDDFVEVLVSTGTTNWTVLYTYNDTNVPSNTGTTNIIDLDAYSGQNVRFAFRGVEGATNGTADIDFSVDNFEIRLTPACIEPTTLSASNVLSTSADLSWVDGSGGLQFDYEYVVQAQGGGMPAGAGTALDISSFPLPVTAGSLTPSTAYEFWVRANCGGSGFSTWVGPFNFTTACAIYTVPATEDFTTYVPGCWQEADNGDLTAGPATFGTSSWAEDGFGNVGSTGATRINIWTTGTNDWILSPLYSIPATGYELKFDAAATQFSSTNAPTSAWESDDYVEVLVSTGTTNWTVLYTYNDTNVPSNTGTTNIIDLDAYSGQNVRFAFRGVEGATNGAADIDFSVDNFEIRMTPACSAPIGLSVSSLMDTSATITWTATTGNYEYVLDMVATDPAGAGTALATETYNATGLTPSTTYYFHVRTVCAGPTYSTWSTISFTTPATPPANNNCSAAQVLIPGGVFADNPLVGTNVGATNSGETAPSCADYQGGDVWYQVTVPASGNITLETATNGSTFDTGLAVYSGLCGSLVEEGCSDDASGVYSLVSLTARTPGEVLLVRVWEYANDNTGTFQVSAYDASLSSNSFDSNAFLAYPNPVKDVLNLEYNSEISNVRVINLLGQEVISRNINANSTQVDMSQLSAGAYIVNVTVGNAVKTIKVVKQ
jgi:Secretion system C-terminal sorting domain/Fibronectin type III domain